jgi:hypothetical protein
MRKRNAHWREIVTLIAGMPLLNPRLQNVLLLSTEGTVLLTHFVPINVFAQPYYRNIAQVGVVVKL